MNWDYIQPVEIHFGKGRVNEIKNIATINIGEKYNKYKVEI